MKTLMENWNRFLNEEEEAYYKHEFNVKNSDLVKKSKAAGLQAGKSLKDNPQTSVSVIDVAKAAGNQPDHGNLFDAGGPGIDFYVKFVKPRYKDEQHERSMGGIAKFLDKERLRATSAYYAGIVQGAKEAGFSFKPAEGESKTERQKVNNMIYGTLTKEQK